MMTVVAKTCANICRATHSAATAQQPTCTAQRKMKDSADKCVSTSVVVTQSANTLRVFHRLVFVMSKSMMMRQNAQVSDYSDFCKDMCYSYDAPTLRLIPRVGISAGTNTDMCEFMSCVCRVQRRTLVNVL